MNHDPHQLASRLFGDDVDKVGHVLYYELEQRHGVGRVAKSIEDDPSFTLGVEYGILAALDKLARMGVIDNPAACPDSSLLAWGEHLLERKKWREQRRPGGER